MGTRQFGSATYRPGATPEARQAGEVERGNRWSIARLIACSVGPQAHGGDRRSNQVGAAHLKLGLKASESVRIEPK